jgi:hypothetical protein
VVEARRWFGDSSTVVNGGSVIARGWLGSSSGVDQ